MAILLLLLTMVGVGVAVSLQTLYLIAACLYTALGCLGLSDADGKFLSPAFFGGSAYCVWLAF